MWVRCWQDDHRLARLCLGGPASPDEAACSEMELLACRLSAFLKASGGHSELGIGARSLLAGLSTATVPADAIYGDAPVLRHKRAGDHLTCMQGRKCCISASEKTPFH